MNEKCSLEKKKKKKTRTKSRAHVVVPNFDGFFSCGLEYVFVCLFIFIIFHESFFPRISPIIYFVLYSVSFHM